MSFNGAILLVWSLLCRPTLGWGDVGHGTVAYVAADYFSEQSTDFLHKLLLRDESSDLYDAATWADKIKRTHPETKPWHYVDVEDDPLQNSCKISPLPGDCQSKGCIVSVMENMTTRAAGENLSDGGFNQGEAVKFLFHFFGDLHMPLHVENYSRGGNDVNIQFDGHKDNLHSIWDTDMPHKLNSIGHRHKHNEEKAAAMKWAKRLVLQNKHRPTTAAECNDVTNPHECIKQWATETNQLNCAVVFKPGLKYLENEDLAGEYYDKAAPIIDEQIFKAGVRLAAWVNALAEIRGAKMSVVVQGGGIGDL